MKFNFKTRQYGQYIIHRHLLRSVNEKAIEALDELIKAGPNGILTIDLRDRMQLGGQPAPYIHRLRTAGFLIDCESPTLHLYKGEIRECGRYTLLSIPHVSMLPDFQLMEQPEDTALIANRQLHTSDLIALDLHPNEINDSAVTSKSEMIAI